MQSEIACAISKPLYDTKERESLRGLERWKVRSGIREAVANTPNRVLLISHHDKISEKLSESQRISVSLLPGSYKQHYHRRIETYIFSTRVPMSIEFLTICIFSSRLNQLPKMCIRYNKRFAQVLLQKFFNFLGTTEQLSSTASPSLSSNTSTSAPTTQTTKIDQNRSVIAHPEPNFCWRHRTYEEKYAGYRYGRMA